MTITSNCKINLSLNVFPAQGGYHPLDTVAVTVCHALTMPPCEIRFSHGGEVLLGKGTADYIKIKEGALGATAFGCEGRAKSLTEESALQAVSTLCKHFNLPPATVQIVKGAPQTGGVGGSCTVLAGVVRAMCELYSLDLNTALDVAFKEIGASDLYILAACGAVRAKGRGELVQRIEGVGTYYVVLAAGNAGVSTADCFKRFDQITESQPLQRADNDGLIEALRTRNLEQIKACAVNMLYPAARQLCSEIDTTLAQLHATKPILAAMSGSGATCFGLYNTLEQAQAARSAISTPLAICCQTL